jgi:putative PIN family toxin of toxin-antitoxin system
MLVSIRCERSVNVASGEDLLEFRVVLDTNVAVSGLLSPRGAPHAIIDLFVHHRPRLRLGASEANRDELLATLRAPRLATRIASRGFTPEALYMLYIALTEPAVPTTLWRGHWSTDPDDDAFLATAFAFRADLLVSRDHDLLNLKQFYGCRIVEPGRALALCRAAMGQV